MIAELAGIVHPIPLAPHHLKKVVEGGLVVVKDQHVLASVDQLLMINKKRLTLD